MNAADQFHMGIVVDDLAATLATLSDLFGYEWCDVLDVATPVTGPGGDAVVELSFVYSTTVPRVEVIRTVPRTLWQPAGHSGIHHAGYWSDDVPGDLAVLAGHGFALETAGTGSDGVPVWAYARKPGGLRVELVSRAIQPALEQLWASGRTAVAAKHADTVG